jgi:hypothetical protein
MNVNQTYKLICNNVDPNIEVQPIIDTDFFQGVYPYVEENQNTYTYSFKPIKTGDAQMKCNFLFKGASIGQPFIQNVKVLAGAYIMGGTQLELRFYPELYESKDGNVIIRVIDNATGNILDDSRILLSGVLVDNNSLHLEQNQLYEIRASHSGYSDLVRQISLAPKSINFTIKSQYLKGEVLNFSTQPTGAKILLDNNIITLPFILDSEGQHTITAVLLGYTETSQNITVVNDARILDSTPTEDAKVGKSIFVTVSRNDSSLRVSFRADAKSESTNINQTVGSTISILAKDHGIYEFYADNNFLKSYTVDGTAFYLQWWFWVIGVVVVIFVIFLLTRNKKQTQTTPMAFTMGGGQ